MHIIVSAATTTIASTALKREHIFILFFLSFLILNRLKLGNATHVCCCQRSTLSSRSGTCTYQAMVLRQNEFTWVEFLQKNNVSRTFRGKIRIQIWTWFANTQQQQSNRILSTMFARLALLCFFGTSIELARYALTGPLQHHPNEKVHPRKTSDVKFYLQYTQKFRMIEIVIVNLSSTITGERGR